jgi:hypothetical protein
MEFCDTLFGMMLKMDDVFPQERTMMKAIRTAFCLLLNPGRNTITQSLVYGGLDDTDWSSAFKLFSRSKWDDTALFDAVIEETIPYFEENYISVAVDDTKIKKTGKKIPGTGYYRDPLSPHFCNNLIYGHRILQFAALLPLYKQLNLEDIKEDDHVHVSRGIPVSVTNVPAVKKPGRRASEQEKSEYLILKKKNNLSVAFVEKAIELRQRYDALGAQDKPLLILADGSFCNSKVYQADLVNTYIAARCRKDARLCFEDTTSSKRFYSKETFTPLSVRQDENIPYIQTKLFVGKKLRKVKYKEIKDVLWQRGAKRRKQRLIVISPKPYKSYGQKQMYKQEAYILTNNYDLDAETIIQQYINRWEIEVNHRDEKNNLGLGQAQVWNPHSVEKVPSLLIAAYSIMLLASLKTYGPNRTEDYLPLPKWRKGSVRPSCNDLVNQLRREMIGNTKLQDALNIHPGIRSAYCVNQ